MLVAAQNEVAAAMAEATLVDVVAEEMFQKYDNRRRAAEDVAACERDARQVAVSVY